MPRFLLEVSDPAFERLTKEAGRYRRSLKDQAAWLLGGVLLAADAPARELEKIGASAGVSAADQLGAGYAAG